MPEFSFVKIVWSLLSFLFVLGLLGLTLYLIKRYGSNLQNKSGKKVKLVESLNLSPKQRLILVEIEGENLLIGVSQNNMTLLGRFSRSDSKLD
tara:strand:+ start:255 stop:533 length:279 start_codon:yes stop_codon:yes gene_type:complete